MSIASEIGHEVSADRSKSPPIEFDILDVALVFVSRKGTIFLATIVGLAVAVLLGYLATPKFTAKAVIMPPQQEQSNAAALMGQLGGLASLAGAGGSLGAKNPNDLYIGILESETVSDSMIKRFALMNLYHTETLRDGRAVLLAASKFVSEKNGMISVAVTDRDPKRAAAMANSYVDELYRINNRLALGAASQRRLFFEQQLAQEKDRLADAEVALTRTEEATGVIAPTGQTESIIRRVAQLQAEITEHEVELDALRTSSTEQNPDVIRLNTQLESLRVQLRDLESGKGKRGPGDISIATANVPQAGLEYVRRDREVKYHQLLFDLLARQYEAARMDEAKAAPLIQVIDPALVPEKKSSPYRALWAVVGCALGFFLSCGWVLASYIYRLLESDEDKARRLALLRQELWLRS
jgi:tyrosine-protein kinase Etk/Wzc